LSGVDLLKTSVGGEKIKMGREKGGERRKNSRAGRQQIGKRGAFLSFYSEERR